MKRKLAGAFSAFYVFLALLGSAEAQELKKVKIGYPAIAYNQIQVWIGKEAGLFKRYGLDAELVYFRGRSSTSAPSFRRASRDTTSC
jgi:ABC-type nitrate/sulfonate/bicarbonate transport system substrate-binding protein